MKHRRVGAALAVAVVSLLCTIHGNATLAPSPSYRDDAIDAAKWIHAARIETPGGVTWPADPADPKSVSTALYSGAPGVVLFLLELHHATGTREYVAQTGYMQGAAGIGMWLLRLDAAGRGRTTFVRFPDTPWPPP
jgi:hypothetical protein